MVVCVSFLQWSVKLITSFIDFMERFVGVLSSHIYQPYATAENPIPVLPDPCPLRYLTYSVIGMDCDRHNGPDILE